MPWIPLERAVRNTAVAAVLLVSAAFPAFANSISGNLAPSIGVTGNSQGISVTPGSNSPTPLTVKNTTIFYQGSAPLLPSSWGGTYTLTINAIDSQGNTTTKKVQINYQPAYVSVLTGRNGSINLPAVPVAFTDSVGRNAITTDIWKTSAGTVVTGSQQVWATSAANSTASVTLNGVEVDPGQTVSIGTMSFTNGVLSVPAMATGYGQTGSASILLSTQIPGAPVAQATLNLWSPKIALSTPQTIETQAVSLVSVTATPSTKLCTITTDPVAAQQANMIDAPACYLNWTTLPSGMVGSATGASGRLTDSTGQQTVAYTLSLFNGSTPVQLDQGQVALTVAPATTSIVFGPSGSIPTVVAGADSISMGLAQTQGPKCVQTTTQAAAQAATQAGQVGCWIQWTALADGISQDTTKSVPWVSGTPTNPDNPTVVWSYSVVTADGTAVPVGTGNFALNVVPPVQPTIGIAGITAIDATHYVAPYAGGAMNFQFSGSNTEESVSIVRNGQTILAQTIARNTGSSATRTYSVSSVQPPNTPWGQTSYQVTGTYVNLPSMTAQTNITVTNAPDVTPLVLSLALPGKQLLDSGTATATVSMQYGSAHPTAYDQTTMGQWQVKLVQIGQGSSTTDLTAFAPMDPSGVTQIPIDMTNFASGVTNITIQAVASLVSSVPGYNVQKLSSAVSVGVVDGSAVDGTVVAAASSGAAPLMARVNFTPTRSAMSGAIGSVSWNVSPDNGTTWSTTSGTTVYSSKLNAGSYLVNATTTNKYSGATSTTPNTTINVFTMPAVKITGPATAMSGDSPAFTAAVTANGQALADSDVVIKWRFGATSAWNVGTLAQTFTSVKPGNYAVTAMVRLASAPDVASSYTTANVSLSVVNLTGPRITLNGPQKPEVSVQSTWTASLQSPIPNVVATGYWTLPDGTQIPGTTLTWTPNDGDLQAASETLVFTGYLTGYQSQTTVTQNYPIQIWQYTWPSWQITQRKAAPYAPASDTLSVAPLSLTTNMAALGTITYNWSFPSGVQVTSTGSGTKSVSVLKPGDYPYTLTISNERGNISTLNDTISLPAPPAISTTIIPSYSNTWSRAPLTVTMRGNITVGHPLDKVTSFTWSLDGSPMPNTGTLYTSVTLPAGNHVIELSGTSQLGFPFDATLPVNVVPDVPPTCTIAPTDNGTSWTWRANCSSTDGKVVGYTWWINNVKMTLTGAVLSQNKSSTLSSVQLVATDDAGEQSTPAVWTP
jgi:hypothetical protein